MSSAVYSTKDRTKKASFSKGPVDQKEPQARASLEATNTPIVSSASDGAAEPIDQSRRESAGSSPGPVPNNPSSRDELNTNLASSVRPPPQESTVPRNRSGAVKAMDRVIGFLAAGEAEGEFVISEIEPDLIERSFVGDRIEDQNDFSINDLIESIRENGQQVPILVRSIQISLVATKPRTDTAG